MQIRTIAVFHCQAFPGSAWCCAEGIVMTLMDLGYQVMDCGRPNWTVVPIEALSQADLIIMSAVEWYDDILAERYGEAWFQLKAVKVAWYAESAHRDDRDFPFERVRPLASLHYFPAIQDADEFGGHWLPFGADTTVFKPKEVETQHDVAFLGSMYPKRVEYLQNISADIAFLSVVFHDDRRQGFELLAASYCTTRIFLNLPSYSRLLVTKVTEVMACKVMLITPGIDHPSGRRNMAQFEDGKHLVYYDPERPQDIGEIIRHYIARPAEREAIAEAGWRETLHAHTLRHRLERVIGDVLGDLRSEPVPANAGT
jgi:hypothetical protein